MIRILLFFLLAMTGTASMTAQSKSSILQRINAIKSNNDEYYWYQFAHFQGDTAKHYATKFLLQEINYEREEADMFSIEELEGHIEYLVVDRGNAKQYLAYMKKSYATRTPRQNNSDIETQGPVVKDKTPIPLTESKRFIAEGFVLRIKEVETFKNAYKLLRALQANGEVLQFGSLKEVEDYSSFDLILFDTQSQQIITVLSAEKSPGVRTDLLSGMDDSLDNYPREMTAVIWYIRK